MYIILYNAAYIVFNLLFSYLGAKPYCALVVCGKQPVVEHAVSKTDSLKDLFLFNSTIHYTCKDGFKTDDETVVRVSLQCIDFVVTNLNLYIKIHKLYKLFYFL